uniref:SURP motif domain-containing protein n=1 Tax=Phlebotomus papatasi TaxID=29031 RepID=A0A1B0D972_PHLPP
MASASGSGGASGHVESGILRKRSKFSPENQEELLVFGYQCHLFRDDEKAQFIDQGKHLIPWMNDNSIKIDRYDVRATLNDLKMYEAPPGGYTNRLDYLSAAEQKAEQLCEEERYYSLYHNEREEEYQQEEELKRLQTSSYAQVSFSYDNPPAAALPEKQPSVEEEEVDEEVFEPSANFPIPSDIELPPTVKLNAIIEKTARFIAMQGTQMEILIKTKQANNPQFEFLTQNGRFNRYYKFILTAIKDNRYPSPETDSGASNASGHVQSVSGEVARDASQSQKSQQKKALPVLKYKPSADCAYTQLISKITGAPLPSQGLEEAPVEITEVIPEPSSHSNGKPEVPQLQDNEKVDFRRKAESVEVKKISTGLMLAQCYNSESESDDDSNSRNSLFKLDLPVPPESLQHIIDKTAAYVAKNGKDFEDILRTKHDPRFSFLDESSEYHRYYIYKVTGSIYLPSSVNNGDSQAKQSSVPELSSNKAKETASEKEIDLLPKVMTPVCFSIRAKDDPPVPMKPVLPQEPSSDEEVPEKNGSQSDTREAVPEEKADSVDINRDLGINVEEILEMEEKKEAKRAEEKVRDKLAAAAREKLGLISKEKQLQLERKKKAMAFLTQIKTNATATAAVSGGIPQSQNLVGNGEREQENNSDSDVSIHSLPSTTTVSEMREKSRSRSRSKSRKRRTRSRSRTRSSSTRSRSRSRSRRRSPSVKRKKKKSKHEHGKKKSKRKSRSRSGSRERKHKKKSSKRRSEDRHR